MLYKLISSALLVLVLAQGTFAAPQGGSIEPVCGGPTDIPCPSGQLCCGSITGVGNVTNMSWAAKSEGRMRARISAELENTRVDTPRESSFPNLSQFCRIDTTGPSEPQRHK
ncbi:hypothetical protein C8F04DRAFT_1239852 [Mycena alexandri]|uniref:Hydrophobin n=1 Tax=Mycena alexandri TaxID=1745969 RepID=A0AAD6S9X2_9AGAR|nr:hypothetical protein C8F04DRAFT_1239852 [Mycena alexandri]